MERTNEEQTPTRTMTKTVTTTVTTTKSTVCVSGSTETDTFLKSRNPPTSSPFSINNNSLLTTINPSEQNNKLDNFETDIQDNQSSRRSSLAVDDLNRNSSTCDGENYQKQNGTENDNALAISNSTTESSTTTKSMVPETPSGQFKTINFDFKAENHTVNLCADPMSEYSFADCSSDSHSCSSGSFSSGSFTRGATASWNSSSLVGSFGRRKKQDTAFAFAEPFQLGSKRRKKEDNAPKKSVSTDQSLLAQLGEKSAGHTIEEPVGGLMYTEVESVLRANSPLAKLRRNSLEADFKFAVYSTQGQRPTMEDMYQVIPFTNRSQATGTSTTINLSEIDSSPQPISRPEKDSTIINNPSETSALTQVEEKPNYAFFAVYDGHGGNQAAQFVSSKLHNNIVQHPQFSTNTEEAIREGFLQTEKQFEEETIREKIHGGVGTTACVGVIFKHTLYIANVGDSAAILCRKGKPIPLTNPHTVKNPKEKERITSLGGVIVKEQRLGHPLWNPHLINIGVTRAFGDFYFKQKEWTDGKLSGLTAEPEIVQLPLTTDDYFLLLASDGFWDVIGTQQAISLITTKIGEKQDLNLICKELTDLALKRATEDNTTVLLVKLKSLGACSQPNSNCNMNDYAQTNTTSFSLQNEGSRVVM